jgi:hypothetical protein
MNNLAAQPIANTTYQIAPDYTPGRVQAQPVNSTFFYRSIAGCDNYYGTLIFDRKAVFDRPGPTSCRSAKTAPER